MVVGIILVSCYSVGQLRISGERHLHEASVCFRSSGRLYIMAAITLRMYVSLFVFLGLTGWRKRA